MKQVELLSTLLPKDVISLLIGKLLGDANLNIQEKKRPRLYFSHCAADREWCYYCYTRLKDYIPVPAPVYTKVMDKRVSKGYTEKYYVQSRTSEVIDLLKESWYPNNSKTIPFELLNQYLSREALAWWYQDDGHLKREKGIVKKVVLSTDAFTKDENTKLTKLLYDKFQLTFSVDGQNRLLLYDQPQMYYFLHLIKPFIHNSMNRKQMVMSQHIPTLSTAKRTTIYLPIHIEINEPTKEITNTLKLLPILQEKISNRNMYENLFQSYFPIITNTKKSETNGYQIQLSPRTLQGLYKIKIFTGLNYSQITYLCFLIK
ncbi:endonuclease [Bacillus sp. CGMCC 1.16541]|uniref:endonuclease n=1 Tax=Bacillus sp. CGMCC 1.16541 TaxID=2185143 RepID=UPI0013A5B833|nr:endonuclease [Bacillus sp. CGMCC 1.16541]